MPIFKMIDAASKVFFNTGKTAVKEASKHKWSTPKWQYEYISDKKYQFLHSSDYLRQMANDAIKNNDYNAAMKVIRHIEKHRAGGIESYGKIIKFIEKGFRELNLIDFIL